MEVLSPSIKMVKRNIDDDAARTWIIYEDNKPEGGIFAKVVSFSDVDNIVSSFPPEQYGTKLLEGSIRILDDTIYGPAGSPTWSVKDLSLNLYQNFLSVAVVMGSLPGDTQTRIHLGKLTVGPGGDLTWTLCATSPINVPERERAYFVIPGVEKEINITAATSNRQYCNGH